MAEVQVGIAELIGSSIDDEDFLEHLANNHERRLLASIRGLREDITDMLTTLDTTPAGTLAATKANIKMAQSMHSQLVKQFEKQYNVTVDEMLGDFSGISDVVKRRFRSFGDAMTFTGIDKTIMDQLRLQTYRQFAAFGEDARDAIARAMYDHVIRGSKFSTLRNTIAGVLTGHTDARGRPMTLYATTYAHDAVHDFHNAVTLKKAEDLNYNHFLYVGDIIQTSRPFCITRAGKVYTRRQINSWDSMAWQGKRGPAFQFRGGYNCRHHWRPVRKEWLTDDVDGEEISQEEVIARMAAKGGDPGALAITRKIDAKKAELKKSSAHTEELKKEYYGMKGLKGKEYTTKRAELYALYKAGVAERKVLRAELTELKDELKAYGGAVKKKATTKVAKPKAKPKPKLTVVETPPTPAGVTPAEELADRGVRDLVDFSETAYTDWDAMVVKPIADEVKRMMDAAPILGEALLREPITHIKFVNARTLKKLSDRWADTYGIHGGTRMAVAGSDFRIAEKSIRVGKGTFSISTGASAEKIGVVTFPGEHISMITFRHEFGHHVHSILLKSTPALREFDWKWQKLWDDKGSDWFKKHVSKYSGTNVKEAFAESWAAITSKRYKPGMLPKEIEEFFDELFEGKIKPIKLKPVPKITLKKAAEKVKVTKAQKNAINYAAHKGALDATRMRQLADRFGITTEELNQLMNKFYNDAKISVRRQLSSSVTASYKDIFENGKFKNQFQLGSHAGTSSGYLGPFKGSGRDRWENNITNGALHKSATYRKLSNGKDLPKSVAKERPIYGFVRDPLHPRSADQYGDIEFILHDKFKAAATITRNNSSALGALYEDLGTMENAFPALDNMAREMLRTYGDKRAVAEQVRRILSGQEEFGGWARGRYIEAQIYGGIDLARGDVVKIVIHSRYGYGGGLTHIEQLAKRYNIPVEYY